MSLLSCPDRPQLFQSRGPLRVAPDLRTLISERESAAEQDTGPGLPPPAQEPPPCPASTAPARPCPSRAASLSAP